MIIIGSSVDGESDPDYPLLVLSYRQLKWLQEALFRQCEHVCRWGGHKDQCIIVHSTLNAYLGHINAWERSKRPKQLSLGEGEF